MYASGWRLRGGGASLRFSLKRRLAGCFYLLCALYFPRAISSRRLRLQHKSTRSQAPPTNHLALCLCEAPPHASQALFHCATWRQAKPRPLFLRAHSQVCQLSEKLGGKLDERRRETKKYDAAEKNERKERENGVEGGEMERVWREEKDQK